MQNFILFMMRCIRNCYHFTVANPQCHTNTQTAILLIYIWTNQAQTFKCNSENAPATSILTDRCRGKDNGEDWRVGVKNVRGVVVGMIK